MTYFPPATKREPEQCPGCKGWFVVASGPRVSCCVLHPPGSCCHVGEIEVAPPSPPTEAGS